MMKKYQCHIYRKYDNKIEKQSVFWSSESEFLFCLLTVISFFAKDFLLSQFVCGFLLWSIYNLYRKYCAFYAVGKKKHKKIQIYF